MCQDWLSLSMTRWQFFNVILKQKWQDFIIFLLHVTIENEHKDQNEDVNDNNAGDLLPARLLLGFDAAPQQVEASGSSSSGPSDQQQQ